jgi:general secretion pathway protein H
MTVAAGGWTTSGFSLIEMLAALAIAALAAAVVMPVALRPSDTLRLDAAAQDLVAALRMTRAAAIAHNTDAALTVDVERRTFESGAVPARALPADLTLKLKIAEPERMRSKGGFRFFPDGSSTGGDVLLALGGKELKICVDWLSGIARRAVNCGGG